MFSNYFAYTLNSFSVLSFVVLDRGHHSLGFSMGLAQIFNTSVFSSLGLILFYSLYLDARPLSWVQYCGPSSCSLAFSFLGMSRRVGFAPVGPDLTFFLFVVVGLSVDLMTCF